MGHRGPVGDGGRGRAGVHVGGGQIGGYYDVFGGEIRGERETKEEGLRGREGKLAQIDLA